jgi:hypothetical protein
MFSSPASRLSRVSHFVPRICPLTRNLRTSATLLMPVIELFSNGVQIEYLDSKTFQGDSTSGVSKDKPSNVVVAVYGNSWGASQFLLVSLLKLVI